MMVMEQAIFKAREQFDQIVDLVREAADRGERIDLVERDLMHHLLALGHSLLTAYVARQGDGDCGPESTTAHGATIRRLPEPRERRYVSIFGELTIRRVAYGSRERQRIERVPLDERLGLPEGDCSYVLEGWAQRLCLKESFAEAGGSLEMLPGLRLGRRTLEHMNRAMAEHVPAFQATVEASPAEEEGPILVVTADGKGVPMRREPAPGPKPHHRRTKGEKANKKQMACVGAVYSIEPFVRTAGDLLDEVVRHRKAERRPRPRHKHVCAEMTHDVDGVPITAKEAVFCRLCDELAARNPSGRSPVVCLLDGERALWEAQQVYFPEAVGILDLFHVLERLWATAHRFHEEGSPESAEFVEHRLRDLLQGRVGYVIAGLRRRLRSGGLKGERRRVVRSAAEYLENNRGHMRYDVYLAAGYPIGSGVAEGACRHLVKDRMEQTGMRWTVEGARAMLQVRAMYLNGQWEEFLRLRIEREQAHLYGGLAA
jgi:hypothetical protein